MTLTLGKGIVYAAICIGVLLAITGIAALCGAFKGDETQKDIVITKGTTGHQYLSTESNFIPFFDNRGRNIKIHVEENCLLSYYEDCPDLKNKLTELKTLIQENGLTECAIVKMAENDCKKEISGLQCDEFSCSISKDQQSTTDITKLGFWFQNYFKVTKENIEEVKTIHLKRFTCIKKSGTEGLEAEGVCFKKLHLAKGGQSSFQFDFARSFLKKNLKNYSILREGEELNQYQIPEGTSIYSKDGKKVDSEINGDLYVLPSKLSVTKETVSWMRFNVEMSIAICHSFGLKKLTNKEIEALPTDPHLDCFFDNEGNKLTELKSTVWALGKNVGTHINFVNITDNDALLFAFKKRNVLFVKSTVTVPDNLVVIHDNVILKKSSSRTVYSPDIKCSEFEENEGFKKFLTDGFVILSCEGPKINHLAISNAYLYSAEIESLPEKFNVDLLQSFLGQKFFVRYGKIVGETELKSINLRACKDLLEKRNADLKFKDSKFECLEKDEKTYIK